jgi:two-component system sensor histidine kinase YesM
LNDGVVEVRFQKQNDQLHIMIQDTGVGMEEDKLDVLRNMMLDPSLERLSELSSIGVMNAYIRLRMYFDERVQVDIVSERYKGTTIRIQIPLVQASQG